MLNKNDKIIRAKLYTPHVSDFVCERMDGTHYLMMSRHETEYYELLPNPTGATEWIWGKKIEPSK